MLLRTSLLAASLEPQTPSPRTVELGGAVRERYERFDATRFGAGPQDADGYFLHRALLHASWGEGSDVHALAELQAAFVSDRTGGPRSTDEDRCDLHQAYLDVRARVAEHTTVTTRVGRTEVAYGSQRLISVREGPNVRLAFDGARVAMRSGDQQLDVFVLRPVEVDPGEFDDDDLQQTLLGAYATLPVLPAGGIDVYCLLLQRDRAEFEQGIAAERRWSCGVRVFGRPGVWDYDCEAVWQAGRWDRGDISAWTLATDFGVVLPLPTAPRLGLKLDVASGDRDPGTQSLQTFHALFPRGSYFGEPALIGPANLFDLHPSLTIPVSDALRLAVDADWFWRQTLGDGVYGGNLAPMRAGGVSTHRYVGHQLQLRGECALRQGWTATIVWAHFFAGSWLADTGPSQDVAYLGIWTTVHF